jgi:WhiB family redox-sensing transcriptional regulator
MISDTWNRLAKCPPHPELFFSEEPAQTRAAKRICATCPVQRRCLEAGMTEKFGVWGGLTALERKRLTTQAAASGE